MAAASEKRDSQFEHFHSMSRRCKRSSRFKFSFLTTAIILVITNVLWHPHYSSLVARLVAGNGSIGADPSHSATSGPKLGLTRVALLPCFLFAPCISRDPKFLNVLSTIRRADACHGVQPSYRHHLHIIIVLVWFEVVAWIPPIVAICTMLGLGGQNLASEPSANLAM
ncbi:hypothetical protein B0H13DRAFT_2499626 [Mycena leptocephala]|nr:hypothetical protein B0H13DRAFT_2499626 [Mycena leptocephala]